MAVDSRDKRFAIMHLGRPAVYMANPSGTVGDTARTMLLGMYLIASGAATVTHKQLRRGMSGGTNF